MATNIIVTHYGNYTVKDFYSYYNTIRSDLVDQTKFWSDLEEKTERLSSLEKFMQIRTKTEVCSKN